jgi:outer membrane protein OmpA-like peptidoglycan-associated protein
MGASGMASRIIRDEVMVRLPISAARSAHTQRVARRYAGHRSMNDEEHLRNLANGTDLRGGAAAPRVSMVATICGSGGACVSARIDGQGATQRGAAYVQRTCVTRSLLVAAVGLALTLFGCGAPQARADSNGAASPNPSAPASSAPDASGAVGLSEPVPSDRHREAAPDAAVVATTVAVPQVPRGAEGRPTQTALVTSAETLAPNHDVYFSKGETVLGPQSKAILDELLRLLATHPEIQRIAVEGHADASEPRAMALSRARADAVVAYLVAHGGAQTFVPAGVGTQKPRDPSGNAEARARNRCVVFRIVPAP